MMKKFVTRYYNSLELINNKIVKTCSFDRVKKETNWFKVAQKLFPENVPEVYKVDVKSEQGISSFEMEYIEGDNLFEWINKQTEISVVKSVFQDLINIYKNKVHKVKKKVIFKDIKQMYFEKPLKALDFYSKNQNSDYQEYIINNKKYFHPKKTIHEVYGKLKHDLMNTSFTLIHGDATFSNTLISSVSDKLYLVDPRGGFGSTEFYGDHRYDFAKLYYSIVGNFDSLNNGFFKVSKENNKYTYEIRTIPFAKELEKMFITEIGEDKVLVKYIHATIWLSLVPHLKNNEEQMLVAFLHGTKLLNDLRV